MPVLQFSHGLDPYWANYNALYPSRKSGRECMPQNVVRPIHVGVNRAAIRSHERGPLDAAATIGGLLADRLQVQEGALRGVAFFLDDDPDAGQCGFVGQHLDEGRVGDRHKVLIVDLADVDCLLPANIVANDQYADPFPHHPVHDIAGRKRT